MRTKLNEGVVVSIEFLSPQKLKKTQISSMDRGWVYDGAFVDSKSSCWFSSKFSTGCLKISRI